MRSADAVVTVSTVARDHPAEGPSRLPLPAAISRRRWLAGAALAVCAALLTLALTAGPNPHQHLPQLLLVGVACSPIVLLRRWPLIVLAVATVANALIMAKGIATLPPGIVLGVASYFAASRLPRRVSITAAAASAVALGAALVYATFAVPNVSPVAEAVEGLLPLATAWFIGDSVAARRRYLAGLAEHTERERTAEAELARQQVLQERVRIARELHDVVAHTLAVITVQAGVGRRLMARRPEEASTALESIETIGRTAQEELRVVLGLLRDEETGAAALTPAPGFVDVKELVETVRTAGTPVDLQMSGTDRRLSAALELSVYRVVQEALTNVVKHAPGARATVDLAVSADRVRLGVTDDGGPTGHPAGHDSPARGTGHGIVGMRERIGAFGGWLVAEPAADRGFRVIAEVPIEGAV
jgi:signal transduction histidine kinase